MMSQSHSEKIHTTIKLITLGLGRKVVIMLQQIINCKQTMYIKNLIAYQATFSTPLIVTTN